MKKKSKSTQLVYSTETGRINSDRDDRIPAPKADGIVRIRRETKGRKGKTVTIIVGITAGENELNQLAKELKQKCASGGSVKENTILIQGDHQEILFNLLTQKGYRVKMVGG